MIAFRNDFDSTIPQPTVPNPLATANTAGHFLSVVQMASDRNRQQNCSQQRVASRGSAVTCLNAFPHVMQKLAKINVVLNG